MNSINTKNIKRNFPNNIYEKGFRDKRGDKSDNQQGNSKKIQKVLRQQCKDIFKTDRTTDYSFFEKSKMIEINKSNIREFLEELDFSLKEGEELTYSKNYRKHNNYEIEIVLNENDFKKSKINYGTEIKINRETTTNFSQQENFVILECVNKILEKGYKPEKIILEKDWKLGHKEKGCLDINILDEEGKSFIMIECKTWNKEYKKERNKMYDKGGQLFSYFVQDKRTKYLCLYTSLFNGKTGFIHENSIIKVTDEIRKGTNILECFENWKPQVLEEKGIFEEESTPYNIKFIGLRKDDLNPLTKEDGGDIFNRFAEILRKNVVSDKTNAYNKIFNLFLCKIVDEYERGDKEKLKFQWEEAETNEDVLLRLNALYKQGMKEYLDLNISSIDINEIDDKLKNIRGKEDKEKIKKLFIEQKLYTSNDFAFKEVFDKNTFDLNSIVVKEVVKLLEKYKIKYETKQQFLGDFFEKLLNTGIKQEVGQFFTPVPIAQFICKSLPIWSIIKEKNKKEEIRILPHCIDYSSGSGHFLTEIMEEINHYVENKIDDNFIKNGRGKKEFKIHRENFRWAEEYIYGIEKDYRLAKTTKISTFLNGDGEAVVICGDGLDNFNKSKDYKNKLKTSENKKDNEVFDIIVANPPYSVSGFKTTLNNGRDSFDLFDEFTDKSNEIECLFVERTKQLLKEGGVAGIVLPPNVLDGEKVYAKVRELILDNFEIKAIVKLGKDTFVATNTATTILFLRKVKNEREKILYYLDKGLSEKKDLTINNIEKPISKYLEQIYKISFKDYLEFFENSDIENKKLKKIKIYASYLDSYKKQSKIKSLSEFVKEKEMNKLLYFILTFNKKIVFYNIPLDGAKEHKKILGYEFSTRKGYEGIHILKMGGALYNPSNLFDETKVSNYILNNFENKDIEIKGDIPYLSLLNLNEMIDFNDVTCSKVININKYEVRKNKTSERYKKALMNLREEKTIEKVGELLKKYSKKTKIKILPLKDVLIKNIETGGTPHTRTHEFWEDGTINWLKIGDITDKYIYDTEKKITEEGRKDKNLTIFNEGTILFSIFATIGKMGILKTKSTLNQAVCAIIPNEDIILPDYLYYVLMKEKDKLIKDSKHRTQDNSNQTKLKNLDIPLIENPEIQKEFIKEIQEFEKTIKL